MLMKSFLHRVFPGVVLQGKPEMKKNGKRGFTTRREPGYTVPR
ncbi:hypothetical protein AtDm6_2103 [Acetobacter tropicalis]|uniref:Uncharacterized protein n=1 Tax=Acetobacter tropicalis TaxID=104102 RepID=A0A095B1N6_9PROT|nr:hypothetical protein AtDm6_2103 [Acetobacter tropicalis]